MLTRVKEILVAALVICISNLEKGLEWTAHLNLKMKRLNHNFPHSSPHNDFILFIITNDFLHFSFKFLCCYYDKLFCFKKKKVIHLIYNFTTYELYIFFFFDLSYIFCLYFLFSFNYEDSLLSFD